MAQFCLGQWSPDVRLLTSLNKEMKMNFLNKLCLLVSITAVPALADTSTTIYWPHHGDRVTKTHYEYVEVPSDTTIWDFSHAIETGDCHEMRWINLGDTLLLKIEQGVQSVYQLHGEILYWNGFENALLCVRDSIAPVDALNVLINGCGVSSPFYFHGSYSGNHAIDMIGNYSVALSENGKLILPNDTVDNAFCVTATRSCLERVSEHKKDNPINEDADTLLREIEVVKRWYSPLFRYPLAENVSCSYYSNQVLLQQSEVTYLCSPEEQEYSLGLLANPESLLRKGIVKGPNGTLAGTSGLSNLADHVSISQSGNQIDVMINESGIDNKEFVVLLCDLQGHVFQYSKQGASGIISFNKGNLNSGVYIIDVTNGDDIVSKKIYIN